MARPRSVLCAVALILGFTPHTARAQLRIGCVGDSITYGYGLDSREQDAYPEVLASLLGAQFEVENFGDSGSTLQNAGDEPWRAQTVYSACFEFAPDVVIVMLGTNDAKPSNWSEAGFVTDYHALITEFRDLGAEVYVATPPPVVPPGAFEIPPSLVNESIVPLVRQIAADAGAPLIDVYAALDEQPELLPDTVHPNAAGARVIAETVADALAPLVETTRANTESATVTGASTAAGGGSGGSSSSSGGMDSSDGSLTASSTNAASAGQGGAPQQGSQQTTGASSTGFSGQMSTGPATSSPASSGQVTLATSSADSSTGFGGASAAPAERESGCACAIGAAARTRVSWFWSLVALAALTRRRAWQQRA